MASSDGCEENWAIVATLIEPWKLRGVDAQVYLASALAKIVNGHPIRQIDDLLPCTYVPRGAQRRGLTTALTIDASTCHRARRFHAYPIKTHTHYI
jgi:hypothetical protein